MTADAPDTGHIFFEMFTRQVAADCAMLPS